MVRGYFRAHRCQTPAGRPLCQHLRHAASAPFWLVAAVRAVVMSAFSWVLGGRAEHDAAWPSPATPMATRTGGVRLQRRDRTQSSRSFASTGFSAIVRAIIPAFAAGEEPTVAHQTDAIAAQKQLEQFGYRQELKRAL